jgi:hypothetical protein
MKQVIISIMIAVGMALLFLGIVGFSRWSFDFSTMITGDRAFIAAAYVIITAGILAGYNAGYDK